MAPAPIVLSVARRVSDERVKSVIREVPWKWSGSEAQRGTHGEAATEKVVNRGIVLGAEPVERAPGRGSGGERGEWGVRALWGGGRGGGGREGGGRRGRVWGAGRAGGGGGGGGGGGARAGAPREHRLSVLVPSRRVATWPRRHDR